MKTFKTLLFVATMVSLLFSMATPSSAQAGIPYPPELPKDFKQAPIQIRCEVPNSPTKFTSYQRINLEEQWIVSILGRDNKALYLFSHGWIWEKQNNNWVLYHINIKDFAARNGTHWEKIFDIPKATTEELEKMPDYMNYEYEFSNEEIKYVTKCSHDGFKKWLEDHKTK